MTARTSSHDRTSQVISPHVRQFYIGGLWVDPSSKATAEVINPATEQAVATIALGNSADVDASVAAATAAFVGYSQTSPAERVELLDRVIAVYKTRLDDLAVAMRLEMGAPALLARRAQAPSGLGHLITARKVLESYDFETSLAGATILRQPIGSCALITPWNWPMNQVVCKVAPALAAGCTMVLKPSEISPLSALILAEILDEAGVPPGVFNLVNGTGRGVGTALTSHPDIDMVSFTGSTAAGIAIAAAAAPTIKRVAQELGGKSASVVLDDADLAEAVERDTRSCFSNSGQSCAAPTRLLVPRDRMDEAADIAGRVAEQLVVGDPALESTEIGPVVSAEQFEGVQRMITAAIADGATLVAGGPGRPDDLPVGFYVRPTVFSHVTNDMDIARKEVFGPVLVIIGYDDDDDAVRIANDSPYGLSGYVTGGYGHAMQIARRLRTGNVYVNGAAPNIATPFGGYRQSGNGREWGIFGLEEYLEVTSILAPPDSDSSR